MWKEGSLFSYLLLLFSDLTCIAGEVDGVEAAHTFFFSADLPKRHRCTFEALITFQIKASPDSVLEGALHSLEVLSHGTRARRETDGFCLCSEMVGWICWLGLAAHMELYGAVGPYCLCICKTRPRPSLSLQSSYCFQQAIS